MDELPIELFQYILQHLSQRNIATCTRVCKKWYISIKQPQLFYNTIELYNVLQTRKFLNNLKKDKEGEEDNKKSSIPFIHNIHSIGSSVQHINIHYDFKLLNDTGYNLFRELIVQLLINLPNLQSLHILEYEGFRYPWTITPFDSSIFSNQHHLTHIPYWYTEVLNINKERIVSSSASASPLFDNKKIKSIDYRIPFYPDIIEAWGDFLSLVGLNEVNDIDNEVDHDNNDDGNRNENSNIDNNRNNNYDSDDHNNTSNMTSIPSSPSTVQWIDYKYTNEAAKSVIGINVDQVGVISFREDYTIERIVYESKILILPTFVHLKSLSLSFSHTQKGSDIYEYDERSLESIHQSCPQLEKLKLHYFCMNISKEYEDNVITGRKKNHQHHQPILPAETLKEIDIRGVLMDHQCYSYLSKKYINLESFTFTPYFISYQQHNNMTTTNFRISPFRSAIFNMITSFTLLKRLSIHLHDRYWNQEYWPHEELLQWLQDHPYQLDHLSYPYNLYDIMKLQHEKKEDNDDDDDDRSKSFIGHPSFLNHLKSLKVNYFNMIDFVTNHILFNKMSTSMIIVSHFIKTLNINMENQSRYCFYIYDWLDMFPNLSTLMIEDGCIKDDDDSMVNIDMNENDIPSDIYLNKLLKHKRNKQQQQQVNERMKEQNNKMECYKLKELHIKSSTLQFKNGLNSFFKRFHHLKIIYFDHVIYKIKGWVIKDEKNPYQQQQQYHSFFSFIQDQLHINLSHLSLDFFSIYQLDIQPWNSNKIYGNLVLTKLQVKELLSQKNYTIIVEKERNDGHDEDNIEYSLDWIQPPYSTIENKFELTIYLTCNYVDEFLFLK